MQEQTDWVRIDTPNGIFWTRQDDFVTGQLSERGGHQRSELGLLQSFVKPGAVVLDVGAHIGTFTVPLARAVGAEGHVYAFEPVKGSLRLLERNIAANDVKSNATATHCLVTDVAGEYTAQLSDDHTSAAHFTRASEPLEGDARLWTTTLDEWGSRLERLDVLKVDTEGMELRVLRSGRGLIERFRPVIMVEVCGDHLARQGDTAAELGRFLRGLGYRFFYNLGHRHATNEDFQLARLLSPTHHSGLYDLIAVHRDDPRMPRGAASAWPMTGSWLRRRIRTLPGGIKRRLVG